MDFSLFSSFIDIDLFFSKKTINNNDDDDDSTLKLKNQACALWTKLIINKQEEHVPFKRPNLLIYSSQTQTTCTNVLCFSTPNI